MQTTLATINAAMRDHPRAVVAFSGGSDSAVLVDLIFRRTNHRPPLLFVATPLEYPQTRPHVEAVAAHYKAELQIITPAAKLPDFWNRYGWPMLGKAVARTWTREHRRFGFKLDCSTCCRKMKLEPARRWMKAHDYALQFVGTRGDEDSASRGMRAKLDGTTYTAKADAVTVCAPLTGWTDLMVKRYTAANKVPQHPLKARTTGGNLGCALCGGGAQFDGSAIALCRRLWPEAWRKFIVDWKAGEIILAVKHDKPLAIIRPAIAQLGGLSALADSQPWIFDHLRTRPLAGYEK